MKGKRCNFFTILALFMQILTHFWLLISRSNQGSNVHNITFNTEYISLATVQKFENFLATQSLREIVLTNQKSWPSLYLWPEICTCKMYMFKRWKINVQNCQNLQLRFSNHQNWFHVKITKWQKNCQISALCTFTFVVQETCN